MRIAIFSDVHLGFGTGTEREGESYTALAEVMARAKDCDAILIAGDLFDCRTPTTDSLAKAMEILLRAVLTKSQTKFFAGIGRDVKEIDSRMPIIAIAGTHERRAKGFINPVQVLERAGLVVALHCNGVIIEKNGQKVAIQGMSGVPEGWAGSVLAEWAPRPVPGCTNILLFHQSIEGIVPGLATIRLDGLPAGFDLYVCGHLHERVDRSLSKGRLLIPGSLISTRITKESIQPRGFFIIDGDRTEWYVLESQRPVFWFSAPTPADIEKVLNGTQKPIIRIEGLSREQEAEFRARFENRAILSFKRDEEIPLKPVSIEEHRLSVAELGQTLLRQNLDRAGLEPAMWEQIFELLADGKVENVQQLLNGNKYQYEREKFGHRCQKGG